jgi:hypothetical protein
MLVVGAGLLARHVVALPAPNQDPRLSRSLRELRRAGTSGWLAVHVLYAECRCSQRIVAHLGSTQRPAGWQEVVLWVGETAPDPALVRGFDVRRSSPEQLAQLGVEAAPLLVVLAPSDVATYVGGYTDRKQGPDIRDLQIFRDAERSSPFSALPVFGCAVSERLKSALAALPAP